MSDCDVCYQPHRNRRRVNVNGESLLLCGQCGDWQQYWQNLTAEEREQEREAMFTYAAEEGE